MPYRLEIIAFVCGASLMVIELVGSRAVSPFLGTSVFVWTSLIGVILASLSVGYWLGGRLADRTPTMERLSAVLMGSCVAALLVVLFLPLAALVAILPLDLRIVATLVSIILFAPVSITLGMVSPFVARLAIEK